jgi:hypothetical protein
MRIGVIAEEANDVEVLYELTSKLIPENAFSFKQFVGHGCGKLRRKCGAWAENLLARGCSYLVVIHDLDRADEAELRASLETHVSAIQFELYVILIPVQEIEAWLLSDPTALKIVFNMKKIPRVPSRPERISNPKEFLSSLVGRYSKAQYLNTVHNRRIAYALGIESLACCPSFAEYPIFIEGMKRAQASTRKTRKHGRKGLRKT